MLLVHPGASQVKRLWQHGTAKGNLVAMAVTTPKYRVRRAHRDSEIGRVLLFIANLQYRAASIDRVALV
jgi:hypothetical protein